MIVHGGQPPFIEEPDPRFGGVLKKLNEFSAFVEQRTENFNDTTRGRLVELGAALDGFIRDVAVPITQHLEAKGAAHGETKTTIGLSLKDNFRAATLAEHIALANVEAFVTPLGARQAILANTSGYSFDNYQQNDVLQIASYFMPDEYPIAVPTSVEPIRFFNGDGKNNAIPVLLNGDRLVFSPPQPGGRYQRNSLFVSGPTDLVGKTQSQEIQNVTNSYAANGWNNIAGVGANGRMMFFHPIADKNIYDFADTTGLPTIASKAHLMYQGYGGVVYKGMGVAAYLTDADTLTIAQRFFSVTALSVTPTMTNVVDTTYLASFKTPSETRTGALQASHDIKLADMFTLPAGMTVKADLNVPVSVSLSWTSPDLVAMLLVAFPVIFTAANGKTLRATLKLLETIRPGTLRAGGSGVILIAYTGTKDVIGEDLTIPANSVWLEPDDRWNFNSPVYSPGAVLNGGELVRARSTKYGMIIKRYKSDFADFNAWMVGPRPVVPYSMVMTEMVTPARHLAFTALPERIIPIQHAGGDTTFLVNGLDMGSGRYRWHEVRWSNGSMVGVTTGNKSGIRSPDITAIREGLVALPNGMVSVSDMNVDGIVANGLSFNSANQYKAFSNVLYSAGVVSVTGEVALNQASLFSLQMAAGDVRRRAVLASPQTPEVEKLRENQIQVFGLTADRAIFVISDGLCYAEAGLARYTIVGGVLTLDFSQTNGLKMSPITPAGIVVSGVSRTSKSFDSVQTVFSDLLAVKTTANGYSMTVSRPFGELYGDVSFTINNITVGSPIFTPVRCNPARLYRNDQAIDVVDPIYPPFAIPRKGLYQYDPANSEVTTNCLNVAAPTQTIDPFDVNEEGWVRVPAGAKLLLNGRGYILDRDFPVKVNTSGVTYCYIVRNGNTLMALGSSVVRETSNNEVMFGVATNGILSVSNNYLVLDRHLATSTRRGSGIPFFEEDGVNGPNKFFTKRDRI